jgi:hypothetical protein
MKQLLIVSAFAIATASVQAQNDIAGLKQDELTSQQEKMIIGKEKKEKRKELRRLEGEEVSVLSKDAFYADFGNLEVIKWERSPNYDKVYFMKDGRELTAYYDINSQLVGTTDYRSFSDIPASAQEYINKHYKDYTKESVIYFDDNKANPMDMILYESAFNDEDQYFVELKKDNDQIILQASPEGLVRFFKQL